MFRGTPYSWNNWATITGDSRWSYNRLLPILKKMETYLPDGDVPNYEQRGNSGPTENLQIRPPVGIDPVVTNMATLGPTAIGIVNDYNDPTEGTVGFSAPQRLYTAPPAARRSFTSKDFIEPVVDASGQSYDGRQLTIQSGMYVSKVLFQGTKAIGVQYYNASNPSNLLTVYGKRIILCSGIFHTAGILERSGVGDPAILTPLGIPVVVNNPNVGKNVTTQYGPSPVRVNGNLNITAPSGNAVTVSTDLRGEEGGDGGAGYPADGIRRFNTFLTPNNPSAGIINFGNYLCDPKSTGTIHITSTNPTVAPAINLNVFTDGPYTTFGTDANMAIAALKTVKQYADNNGFTMNSPTPADYASDATLNTWLLSTSPLHFTIQAHYYGATRMSSSMSNGVVNGKLAVFGTENLFVADNSVQPLPIDGNPQYSAQTIGAVLANSLLKGFYKKCKKESQKNCQPCQTCQQCDN